LRRLGVSNIRSGLDHADQPIARERMIDERKVTWLEHIEGERSARQEDCPAERKHGQSSREI